MRTILLTLPLLSALGGCIYYESGCDSCDPWDDWSDDFDDDGDDWTDTGSWDDPYGVQLGFAPAAAASGDLLVGTITADVDLMSATEVALYGDVDIFAIQIDEEEILVSLQVHDDAEGIVDLRVTFDDGTTAWLPGALTIHGDGGTGGGTEDPCDE